MSSPSLSQTPIAETPVKLEPGNEDEDQDPLSAPLSPSVDTPEANTTPMSLETPAEEVETPLGRGRTGGRWMRVKRPLKELLNKIMAELRKKDEVS
jgi:hypothetical protein